MCGECEKSFKAPDDLKLHMIKHLHRCAQCKKIFARKSYLNKHIKLHEATRFECTECSYKTSFVQSLTLHNLTMHDGVRRFNCDQCKYKAFT